MSVNIIIVTHGNIGKTLLSTVTHTLGQLPLSTTAVSVSSKCDTEAVSEQLQRLIDSFESDGILCLTDLFGATPFNLVKKIKSAIPLRLVCGVNLPMLLRVMNYANSSLNELVTIAVDGGQNGIRACDDT